MKVVILCGGLGTRLREETEYRPKPLVPIGERPIVWHIMKTYAAFGFTEFVLALGYKGEMIKDFFLNYDILYNDFRLELGSKRVTPLGPSRAEEDWRITFVDTGQETQTGGRLKRLQPYLSDEPRFMLTYGDGVADIDINRLLDFHTDAKCAAVVTGVRPLTRFGERVLRGDAADLRLHRRRSDGAGAAADGAPGGRRSACHLQARRVLAVHGHLSRAADAQSAVDRRARALDTLVGG